MVSKDIELDPEDPISFMAQVGYLSRQISCLSQAFLNIYSLRPEKLHNHSRDGTLI
jgi:hypothetical protein